MKKIVSALSVLFAAACGSPAPDAAPIVVDSAGITVVTNTTEQFQALETHNIDNMSTLISRFNEIVKELRGKPGDMLDYTHPTFDWDVNKFTRCVSSGFR